jgi:hypothetical protein
MRESTDVPEPAAVLARTTQIVENTVVNVISAAEGISTILRRQGNSEFRSGQIPPQTIHYKPFIAGSVNRLITGDRISQKSIASTKLRSGL